MHSRARSFMSVIEDLAGCKSTAKDSFSSLLKNLCKNPDANASQLQEAISTISPWSQPSTIQKTLSKDVSRLLMNKVHESKSIDLLLLSIKFIIRTMKDSKDAVNPVIFEMAGLLLGALLSFDRIGTTVTGEEADTEEVIQARGPEVYFYFTDRLLAFKWKPENLIPTIMMIRDLKRLGLKRMQTVIDKVVSVLPQVPSDSVPALFYQLLLLGRGSESSNSTASTTFSKESAQITVAVFNGIIGYFSTLESMENNIETTEADRAVSIQSRKLESQCATHIVLALKHNQSLATEFLRHARKMARGTIPRFALMILLSMTESYRFATIVPPLIKVNILTRLSNAEVSCKYGNIQGLVPERVQNLETAFDELVRSFSFEAEIALKALIGLALDMLTWNGSKFQKDAIVTLSSVILRCLWQCHQYARKELVLRIVEHLCVHDHLSLAMLLDEFMAVDTAMVQSVILSRYSLISPGSTWRRLTVLTIGSHGNRLRTELLSDDDDRVTMAFSVLADALARTPQDPALWSLVRFAVDRLAHRRPLYAFIDIIKALSVIDSSHFLAYLCDRWLIKEVHSGKESEMNWQEVVSNCVDTESGSITIRLPYLLSVLLDHQDASASLKNLILTLDNPSLFRWFTDTESPASQELKRQLISDLYETAVLASLTFSANVPRAFRLFNRHKEFIDSCVTPVKPSLTPSSKLIIRGLAELIQDNLQTNGSDDLIKWLLGKISVGDRRDAELYTDVLADLLDLVVKNESKLKGLLNPLVDVYQHLDLHFDGLHLKWTLEQKLSGKDIVRLAKLVPPTSSTLKLFCAISTTDTTSAKHILNTLLSTPLTAPSVSIQASKDVLALVGEIDADEPDENSFGNEHSLVQCKFINRKSAPAIVPLLLVFVQDCTSHAEWIMKQIKHSIKDDCYEKASIKSLCAAFEPAVQVQIILTRANIFGPSAERLQLTLQKTYKFTAQLLAFLMTCNQKFDIDPLKALCDLIAGSLSPNIYIMIPLVQQAEAELAKEVLEAKRLKKAKGKASTIAAKAARESKLLPTLIFNVELFDKHILEIARKTNVMLVDQIHRSTARDFRIQTEELEEALQNFQLEAISTDDSEAEEPQQSKGSTANILEGSETSLSD